MMIFRRLLLGLMLLASVAQPSAILPLAQADGILILAASGAASGAYDAESDIGLVANDATQAVAEANTEKLSNALNAQWEGGSFTFADGTVGPVLKPIRCAAKQFYFKGTILGSIRAGCNLQGAGNGGLVQPEDEFDTDDDLTDGVPATLGGLSTRFTRIDSDGIDDRGVFRIRNSSTVLRGISFYGTRFVNNTTLTPATRCDAGLIIEGRDYPASGDCDISHCTFAWCEYGVQTVAGYWDGDEPDSEWVPMGASDNGVHADTCVFSHILFAGVDSCFRIDNEQSVGMTYQHIDVGGSKAYYPVVFDYDKGGKMTATGVLINHPHATVLRVNNYSGYFNHFDLRGVYWDHFEDDPDLEDVDPLEDVHLTLCEVASSAGNKTGLEGWHIRMSGHLANDPSTWNSDNTDHVLFKFTAGITNLATSHMLFDFNNGMPVADMTAAGNYYYPNNSGGSSWLH